MFGQYLMSHGFISSKALDEALILQKFKKEKLGRLLKELGYIDERSLDSALKCYLKPTCTKKVTELIKMRDSVLYKGKISEKEINFLKENKVETIGLSEDEVILVGSTYKDDIIEKAEKVFQRKVQLQIVGLDAFHVLHSERHSNGSHKIVVSKAITDEKKLQENNPYSNLIQESIDQALKQGVSDIHYEPFDSFYVIRFRIHGVLSDWKILERVHAEALTAKLKSILNMDLSIVGRPQDSRASFPERKLDIRASSFPVLGSGEKIVLRLQRQDEIFSLEKLGLSPKSYHTLLDAIQKREGLILVSGPTGSGKTTTLYSLLHKMDQYGKNISTLEDPVEKKLPRINQASMGGHKSFGHFERALMRQDPDIILVGEVRDQKSADLCMRLSATGHLVLSTIHANGAVEVIERLKNLGIDNFSIKSNLHLSVAQRLVPKVCPFCSKKADKKLVDKVMNVSSLKKEDSVQNPLNFRTIHKKGCGKCKQGVIGRVALIEFLTRNEIESFIDNNPHIRNGALSTPKTSLAKECLKLASSGIIDTKEVFQVL